MSSRGKSRNYIKLTNFPQQVIMLDNDYIHTFSTMSSLKSSKHTYSQHLGIRHQLKPFRGFTDETKKQISPMLRKPSKNKCIRHYTEIKTSSLLVYSRTLLKEFCKTQSSSFDCMRNSNTCMITR